MNHLTGATGGAAWPPFTVAQWQELEHQALIFKCLKAGLPVPPDLLAPIRKCFASPSARLFHYSNSGYGSFYGNKIDPEPGRCRRTDGKKWRCSKNAYFDSKYCEWHMNGTHNRSRKLVESISNSQSSSAVSSSIATGSRNGSRSLQNLPLNSSGNCEGLYFGSNELKLQMEPKPYGISNKEYRCLWGLKADSEEHNFVPKVSGSVRCPEVNPIDSNWGLMKSRIPLNLSSEPRSNTLSQNYPQLQDFGFTSDDALLKQQQHYFPGREFISSQSVNQEEHQSLQPLFNEWPKSKDVGSYLDDKKSNKNLFSATQLSMSIPMTPSEINARSAPSPTGMFFSI